MTYSLTIFSKAVLAVSASALMACSNMAAQDSAAAPVETPGIEMAAHDTSTTHAAEGYAKPGAALRLAHDFEGNFAPGEVATVRVKLMDEYDAGILSVNVLDGDGVRILSDMRHLKFQMTGNSVHEFDVQFAALEDADGYINILSTVELPDGSVLMRQHGISLKSGDGLVDQPKNAMGEDTDQPVSTGGIVVMDAEETVIQK